MEVVGYFASLLIGLALGMLGGGGSILTVPVLVYLFGIAPVVATTYSLFIVGIAGLAGSLNCIKNKLIDFNVLLLFGIPSVATIFFTRRFVLPAVPERIHFAGMGAIERNGLLMIALAVLMVFAAASMLRATKKANHTTENMNENLKWKILLPMGIVVGFVSGMLGAGCGFIIVPALVLGIRLPVKNAIATSLSVISVNSFTGFLFSPDCSQVNWRLFSSISIIVVAGIFAGRNISVKNSDALLKRGFAWFILFVAAWICVKEIIIS